MWFSGKSDRQPHLRPRVAHAVVVLVILLLVGVAGLSTLQGFANAIQNSQDFQWSPARLFWSGNNPYQVYLEGNKSKGLILIQNPNYAQLLYILFLPFASMSFAVAKVAWAIINIVLATTSALLSAKIFGLSRPQGWTAAALFMMSTPTRVAIGNGQHSLLILSALVLSLATGEFARGRVGLGEAQFAGSRLTLSSFLAGLTYLKYSFSPTLGVAFLRRYGVHFFVLTWIPVLVGLILFALWTGGNMLSMEFLSQPFRVASRAVFFGAGDLLSLLKFSLPKDGVKEKLATLFCLVLAGAVPFLARPRCQGLEWWSFCSIASLTFVTHLLYDYVFYLFPALYAIKPYKAALWYGRCCSGALPLVWRKGLDIQRC